MTALNERQKALEEKYFLDFARAIRVRDRRNRILAKWAAQVVGRADVSCYVEEVITAGQADPGDDDVLLKVLDDLHAANVAADRAMLQEKMRALLYVAAEQLEAEE
ncbi:DUF1476 family protein (plasmid) [Ensifer sp. PDNC004]|uniref:ATPase inhibitor subunit zeta n=1 Tax=unclassified Ensifer TaxID=2633371 RepID=UPI0017839CA8|nr:MULTISPECIES: ATPase inhibitor subunit zeta [unclassified Ensifer]MBD9649893.1 DUF1476 family protein [Ensifer sp. ENS09]QRY70503.1 DUF1476 family protein [Ensifer sp. PDNC004]